MDDANGSWDFDTRYERDIEREPARTRTPRKPVASGTLKAAITGCTAESHEAIKADELAWAALGPASFMPAYTDEPCVLELRTCPRCKSTLAKEQPAKTEEALDMLRREGLL